MKTVLFDCSRLLARATAEIATGIDRVDIRYLDYLMRSSGSLNLVGVYQQDGRLFHIPVDALETLRSGLLKRWSGLEQVPERLLGKLKEVQRATLGTKKVILASRNNRALAGIVDPFLVELLRGCEERIYLNASHHGLLDEDIFFTLKFTHFCEIGFYIHDIIPIDFPEYVRPGDDEVHVKRMKNAVNFADFILCNSGFTRTRLTDFCVASRLQCPPAYVLHIGVEESFLAQLERTAESPRQTPEYQPYFVTVGTIEPRKNHLLLLQVWRDIVRSCEKPPCLFVIGKRGWQNQNTFDFLDRCGVTGEYIKECNNLSDGQMISLLKGARALLYPSFSEGWGMPLVESIAAGTPVIASDIDVFHEASQETATFIDPLDGLGWKQAVIDFSAGQSERRQAAVERMKSFEMPNWDQHFRQLKTVLDDARPSTRQKIQRPGFDTVLADYGIEYQVSTKSTFAHRAVTLAIPLRLQKKVAKFRRTPVRFLVDSKLDALRNIGHFLQRGL